MMRYAALREVNLNTEVQKPSLAAVLEFKGATMECAVESTPHEEASIYTSVLEGGTLMQKFENDDLQEMQVEGEEPQSREHPVRATGIYATVENPGPRIAEKEERDIAGTTKRTPYPYRRQGNRWISMENHHPRLLLRHTSRVIMYIGSRHGDRVSLVIETREQLNPIDAKGQQR